jgi:hypothetical protein
MGALTLVRHIAAHLAAAAIVITVGCAAYLGAMWAWWRLLCWLVGRFAFWPFAAAWTLALLLFFWPRGRK